MKTIVISDLHLTDRFDLRKFNFLKSLISTCDQLIINGDLWCSFSTTFDKFLNSGWKSLFPLMQAKHTIYIYGNHDRAELIDGRFKLFAQSLVKNFNLKNNNQLFNIIHGHQFIKLTNAKKVSLQKVYRRQKITRPLNLVSNRLASLFLSKKQIRRIFHLYNKYIVKKAKKLFLTEQIVVIGHTHVPEFKPQKGYINTGYVDGGFAWYLEITDRSYQLVSARY